jgi:hypothetical protein
MLGSYNSTNSNSTPIVSGLGANGTKVNKFSNAGGTLATKL